MTDIEQIKREVQDVFTEEHRYIVGMAVSYLHSRGYLGGAPDLRLQLEYERGRRDVLMNLIEAAEPKGEK